jgi:predicted DNA-binding transcriptional regulator AlpA
MFIRSFREAAQKLGVSIRTLQRWISVGEGPAVVELGPRRKGILDDDLEGWVLSRRRAPPGEAARKLNQPDEPACSTSEHKLHSDVPRKRGRPPGCVEAALPEREGL